MSLLRVCPLPVYWYWMSSCVVTIWGGSFQIGTLDISDSAKHLKRPSWRFSSMIGVLECILGRDSGYRDSWVSISLTSWYRGLLLSHRRVRSVLVIYSLATLRYMSSGPVGISVASGLFMDDIASSGILIYSSWPRKRMEISPSFSWVAIWRDRSCLVPSKYRAMLLLSPLCADLFYSGYLSLVDGTVDCYRVWKNSEL